MTNVGVRSSLTNSSHPFLTVLCSDFRSVRNFINFGFSQSIPISWMPLTVLMFFDVIALGRVLMVLLCLLTS
jgi:hypothetical protein